MRIQILILGCKGLTGQSWPYSNPGTQVGCQNNSDFGAVSQTDLTRVWFRLCRRLLVTCPNCFCLLFTLFISPSTLNFQQEPAGKPISTGGSRLQKNFIIYMLWFNFILGLNFISLCFGVWKCMVMCLKQREITIKPTKKWNHNMYMYSRLR